MKMRVLGNAFAACLLSCGLIGGPAAANTVTFDSLPSEAAQLGIYVEGGVTVTPVSGGVVGTHTTSGAAHLDDAGTGFTSGLMFTMGELFDAGSFTVISAGYSFFDSPGEMWNNILVTGMRGGSVVASVGFMMTEIVGASQTFSLGEAFWELDALLIEILYPPTGTTCAPCSHLDLDTVVLEGWGIPIDPVTPAPVPLPPSVAMMGLAGLALVGIRRRRRS